MFSLFAQSSNEVKEFGKQVADQESQINALKEQLLERDRTIELLQQQLNESANQQVLPLGLFETLDHFGETLVALQSTLTNLSQAHRKEKDTAAAAADESMSASRGTTALVKDLELVISTIDQAVNNVGNLTSSVIAIDNLINGISEQTNLLALNAAQ